MNKWHWQYENDGINNRRKATWNILTCASKISQLVEIFMESHWQYLCFIYVERGVKTKNKKKKKERERRWRKKKKDM
jgi:hypothetical protein